MAPTPRHTPSIFALLQKGTTLQALSAEESTTPLAHQLAALTHFVHTKEGSWGDTYRSLAQPLYDKWQEKEPRSNRVKMVNEEPADYSLFPELFDVPFPSPSGHRFTFIDLFAGIGGFRLALQRIGGKSLFSSEWDRQAQLTYLHNYGDVPFGDITLEETKQMIPAGFDLLCAGFPCQAFSQAGRRLGFEETRGTLFFDVAEIIRRKQPKAIFLENVKGLLSHDRGRTIRTILKVLREDLGYHIPEPQVLNAKDFGLPQNRERVYIVGFREDVPRSDFMYPLPTYVKSTFAEVKEEKEVSAKYYLSTQYIATLIAHKARHEAKGHGFGYEIIADDGVANAIMVGGMGRERNLVIDHRLSDFRPITKIKGEVNRQGIRRMTPREWARLQGFPDEFIIAVSDTAAYKQFGNSVPVPVVQAIATEIIKSLE